jgi:hypothetical protein
VSHWKAFNDTSLSLHRHVLLNFAYNGVCNGYHKAAFIDVFTLNRKDFHLGWLITIWCFFVLALLHCFLYSYILLHWISFLLLNWQGAGVIAKFLLNINQTLLFSLKKLSSQMSDHVLIVSLYWIVSIQQSAHRERLLIKSSRRHWYLFSFGSQWY